MRQVSKVLPKHMAHTWKRKVAKSLAAEQGQAVTVFSMSAMRHYVSPSFTFSRKRLYLLLIKCRPTGCDIKTNTVDNRASLVIIEAITFAKSHPVHMLRLPPHSFRKTQPLDRNFFRPTKVYHNTTTESWSVFHPGKSIEYSQCC
ncbi:hypothetical protein CDAR_431001 [Caerostris darwini]|uniref:Uncharacterized protein n=1 Tax=Caerostris darwini TaxID=1538125 RepID=A0AAV4UT44_9ARAC|nr:hypothetical protein CDAR_431001 [Caerostris darwini]